MSFLSKCVIDDHEMNVLDYEIVFDQDSDISDKPASDPRGGKIRLVVELTRSTMLYEWMISSSQTKNGIITFYKRDAMSTLRKVEFKRGYCMHYRERFTADSDKPLRVQIMISAKEIIINSVPFSKNWALKL
ncbi:type VI secretion system tube protein TssD [Sinomicrobium weinanense]|uniref:Phage tail protein n=1 Tax=Sinomicrobium weinanense TaxID=2842200 RepID=A0A926JQ34_9FLAO|nr:type VI secretion system tube protein TssD [Sinomicrobium weinanense]MBC9795222.1 hypothetical protein [Sinomicrobium weinanense]MBU3121999.1 hypothetical protein [Sinomicrobium weinanense]